MSSSLWQHGLQLARLLCSSTTPRACSNSRPLSWWCHPATSSPVVPFSSCFPSCPGLGLFPMSQFFASGGHRIGTSFSASVLPINIQGWFPLGLTGFIILQSKELSGVFSSTIVQKHHFFGAQKICSKWYLGLSQHCTLKNLDCGKSWQASKEGSVGMKCR